MTGTWAAKPLQSRIWLSYVIAMYFMKTCMFILKHNSYKGTAGKAFATHMPAFLFNALYVFV